MARFTDTEGAEWSIEITVPLARLLKTRCEVDVVNDFAGALQQLADLFVCGSVLWECCKGQAAERQLSEEQFLLRLKGDCWEQATDAIVQGVLDFFPPARRTILAEILQETRQAAETMGQATLAALRELQQPPQENPTSGPTSMPCSESAD